MKKMKLPLWLKNFLLLLSVLGPGLITASADNDAPGIATYSMYAGLTTPADLDANDESRSEGKAPSLP